MRKGLIKICLISFLILLPINVKALTKYEVVDNYTYIFKQAKDTGDEKTTLDDYQDPSKVGVGENSFCDEDIKKMATTGYRIILYLTPALLILMTSVDFFKAIVSSDADKIKKSSSDAFKRTLAFVILILLAFIIKTIFSWVNLSFCLGE